MIKINETTQQATANGITVDTLTRFGVVYVTVRDATRLCNGSITLDAIHKRRLEKSGEVLQAVKLFGQWFVSVAGLELLYFDA